MTLRMKAANMSPSGRESDPSQHTRFCSPNRKHLGASAVSISMLYEYTYTQRRPSIWAGEARVLTQIQTSSNRPARPLPRELPRRAWLPSIPNLLSPRRRARHRHLAPSKTCISPCLSPAHQTTANLTRARQRPRNKTRSRKTRERDAPDSATKEMPPTAWARGE